MNELIILRLVNSDVYKFIRVFSNISVFMQYLFSFAHVQNLEKVLPCVVQCTLVSHQLVKRFT